MRALRARLADIEVPPATAPAIDRELDRIYDAALGFCPFGVMVPVDQTIVTKLFGAVRLAVDNSTLGDSGDMFVQE